MIYYGDIIEQNGKTVKQNNMKLNHNIPLGSLVEIIPWDEESNNKYEGLRAFIVEYDRDCDGTPLYGISHNKEVIGKTNDPVLTTDNFFQKVIKFSNKYNVDRGFSEDSLLVIRKEKKYA